MKFSKFNHEYLTDILTNIKNENKNIILLVDFNVNLITCNKSRGTYECLEQLFSPQIMLPIRITEKTVRLIDNMINIINMIMISMIELINIIEFCKCPNRKV